MARETFTCSSPTSASVATAWASLQQPATWEAIPGVDRVVHPVTDGDGALVGFGFDSVVGGKEYQGKATSKLRQPGHRLVWDISTPDLRGEIDVRLIDGEAGTVVSVSLTASSVGTLSSVFFPVISNVISDGFPLAVKAFAASLE